MTRQTPAPQTDAVAGAATRQTPAPQTDAAAGAATRQTPAPQTPAPQTDAADGEVSPQTLAAQAVRLHEQAIAASDNGRPAVAARHLRKALRVLGGSDPGIQGRLLLSLAWAESELGQVAHGFALLDEADPLIVGEQRPILHAQRGLMLKRAGRNEEALAQYDKAVSGLSNGDYPLHLVKVLNNRSLTHVEAGRMRLARADLHRCREIAQRHGLAVHVAISRMNLGCLDVVAGDLPSALRAFAVARAEYERLIPGRLGNLAMERARALVAAGLFAEADTELAYAIEQAERQHLSATNATALLVRAEAALLAGRPRASAAWARLARECFTSRANARWTALAALLELRADHADHADHPGHVADETTPRRLAGRALALAGRLERLGLTEDARVAGLVAARCLAGSPAAQRIATRYGPPGRGDRLDTRLLWRLTMAELAPNPASSGRHLLAGLAALHRHRVQFGSLDLQTGASAHGRDLAAAGLAHAMAGRSIPAVFRWSERARAQALLLAQVRPPEDPEAAAALEELRQLRHSLRAAELAGRPVRGMGTRIKALQRTVRERSWAAPGRSDAARPSIASLSRVRAALGGAAMVVHVRSGKDLSALVITESAGSLVPLGDYGRAQEAVLRLRADLDAQAGRAMPKRLADAVAEATRRDRDEVTALTLAPLLPLIGDRELVIVPTGLLMTTPWATLPGCSGRPVTTAPSATSWLAARQRQSPDPIGNAVLVAGPGIPRGEAEVDMITPLYRAEVLSGQRASPAAVVAALDGASLGHLAAHGHHQSENALFSTLELSGGPLMGYDLHAIARMPPVMVLSACDLGLADIRPGDETFGMATAMLTAGAATVVASVTRVADEAALAVMTRFHRLVAAGRPTAAALAEAMAAAPPTGFLCFGSG